MTTKCIVLERSDGGITIRHPAPAARLAGEPEDDFLERIRTSSRRQRDAKAFTVIEEAEVPTDLTFRDAWTFEDKRFGVDMPKALEVQKDRLRRARVPLLEALDLQFMRALEAGEGTQAIVAEKARLRDVTKHPDLESAKTPDELKAVWPL